MPGTRKGTPMYRRILIPTDGSACSERAVEHGIGLAQATRSSITFLFVEDTLRNYHEGVMVEVEQTLAHQGRVVLAGAEKIASSAGVAADWELAIGTPAEEILVRAVEFDLVVMGSHGKGFWKRMTLGSVTEAVLHRMARPLLIVPPVPGGCPGE